MTASGWRGWARPASRRLHLTLAFLFAIHFSACGRTPPPVVVSSPPARDPVHDLAQQIDSLLAGASLERTTWGVVIKSVDRDEALYTNNAHKLLMPASTFKLITLAAAANQLGWDYRYETRVLANGVVANGTLKGDLIIAGSGDPTIDDWDGAATRLFRTWADQLKAAGISRIEGRIIGDDNVFADELLGAGWAWDDLARSFAAGASGLQFNENTAQFAVTAGTAVGEPAHVEVMPAGAPVSFRASVTTARSGTTPAIAMRPPARGTVIDVDGSIPLGGERQVVNVAVENPTLYFVNAVRQALAIEGIEIRGASADIDDIPPFDRTAERAIVTHQSQPLSTIAATLMKESQNVYAETLLRTIAVRASRGGSVDAARAAVLQTLMSWGISPADLLIADGSGLSRYDLITADALVSVLLHVHRDDRLRDPFVSALPIAGRDGTLAERMKGTAAEGNARAKTGSFTNARALAGYVRSAHGEMLAFSILANNYGGPADAIQQTIDAIVVALAQFTPK